MCRVRLFNTRARSRTHRHIHTFTTQKDEARTNETLRNTISQGLPWASITQKKTGEVTQQHVVLPVAPDQKELSYLPGGFDQLHTIVIHKLLNLPPSLCPGHNNAPAGLPEASAPHPRAQPHFSGRPPLPAQRRSTQRAPKVSQIQEKKKKKKNIVRKQTGRILSRSRGDPSVPCSPVSR